MEDLEQNNLEQNAPNLFKLPKEHNLKVPANYFNELPHELLKIASEEKKIKSIHKSWVYIISIAAMLIIGFFIVKPYQTIDNEEIIAYNNSFNNLTAEDFETLFLLDENDYLTNIVDFEDAEELQFLAKELQKPTLSVEVTEEDFENYFESEIEDYY